jgi:hypothetical protein
MNAYGVIEIVKESNLWEPLTDEEKKELIINHVLTSSQPSMKMEVIETVKESNLWEPLTDEEKKELIINHVLTSSQLKRQG